MDTLAVAAHLAWESALLVTQTPILDQHLHDCHPGAILELKTGMDEALDRENDHMWAARVREPAVCLLQTQ